MKENIMKPIGIGFEKLLKIVANTKKEDIEKKKDEKKKGGKNGK